MDLIANQLAKDDFERRLALFRQSHYTPEGTPIYPFLQNMVLPLTNYQLLPLQSASPIGMRRRAPINFMRELFGYQ